ncbi:MAG: hypothetical protein WCG82_04380, partial [Bacteroidota bacterium]
VNFFAKNSLSPFGSPGNRFFLLFFAFDCVGVKMKNPETEAISGFCCKLHFHSAEKEGLLSVIPVGVASKLKLPFGFVNFPFSTSQKQAFFGALVK